MKTVQIVISIAIAGLLAGCGSGVSSNEDARRAYLGLDLKRVFQGLEEFRGVGRRLERLGEAGGVVFIDDYGHHPTEIRATLKALRSGAPGRRIVAVSVPARSSSRRYAPLPGARG